jgi:hypothetical protein
MNWADRYQATKQDTDRYRDRAVLYPADSVEQLMLEQLMLSIRDSLLAIEGRLNQIAQRLEVGVPR